MKNILFFGDSNTWGYDAESYDPVTETVGRFDFCARYPGIVQKLLGSDYHVIEDALNARTLIVEDQYCAGRKGLSALITALDAHAPLDLVVIQLGANELKDMYHLTAGMIAHGLKQLIRAAQTPYYCYPAPKVLIVAPSPLRPDVAKLRFGFSFGPESYQKSVALGPLYREIAGRMCCGFIDCGDLRFELNGLDGLHYSRKDHQTLAAAVAEEIQRMLK